jgi:hypothetical protein
MNSLLDRLTANPPATWAVSAIVGVVTIPLVLFGGALGIVVLAWPAIFLWYGRSRLLVLSGLLSGLGLGWLVLTIVAQTEARLVEPALWLAFGVIVLAVGLGLGVLIANGVGAPPGTRRRHSQPALERDDSLNYFRDLSGRAPGPGVQEEEEVRRWGGRAD